MNLVVPRSVADELANLAAAPDPVTARQARSALETLDSLRASGVDVRFDETELPELPDSWARSVEVARRSGTRIAVASRKAREGAAAAGVAFLDLRKLASDLSPYHPVGEHIGVELVKGGSQPRQGVGYLATGELVVVNDAAHMIGCGVTDIVVTSCRQTSQGTMVFGVLAEGSSDWGSQRTVRAG